MEFAKMISSLNKAWEEKRASLSKEEISYIGDKDSFKGKIHDCFTFAYHKRSKLIASSSIVYGYVFKSWTNEDIVSAYRYPTWVLFSPSKEVNDDPVILRKTAESLLSMPYLKENKVLFDLVHEPLSDVSYYEIPSEYTGGKLVYLSIIYLQNHLVSGFHMGVNLFLMNPTISKEVLYLPSRYFDEVYKEEYSKVIKL